MIIVELTKRDDGFWVCVTGHATGGERTEDVQVCAGVSMLMTVLHTYGAPDRYSFRAPDKGGYVACLIAPENFPHLQFVFRGFQLINEAYPGKIQVPESAKELETFAWKEAPTRPEGSARKVTAP